MKEFFKNYYNKLNININSVDFKAMHEVSKLLTTVKNLDSKIILAGNGGSLSIAGHVSIDLINAAKIKAINLSDPNMITCFSNDYGYQNWVSRALECHANIGDILILISSSGESENMIFGAEKAKHLGVKVITLTGFSSDNALKKLGDINLWVDNSEYNIVEITHQIWLLSIIDLIIKKND